jgi:hypothetical protein
MPRIVDEAVYFRESGFASVVAVQSGGKQAARINDAPVLYLHLKFIHVETH